MTLTLDNFEQQIDPTILERGRRYARDGRVLAVEEEGDKIWSARVKGTHIYEVSIEQTPAGDLFCLCTCPYDWGPTCKHIAAVLYTIEGSVPITPTPSPHTAHKKEETQAENVRQLLNNRTKKELVDFLAELAERDRRIANLILTCCQDEVTSKQGYKELVRQVLNMGRDQHGFIDYKGSMRAARGVWELIRRAQTEAAAGRAEKAVSIYQAVIETLVSAIVHADDSSGSLGDCIDAGLDGLSKISHQLPPNAKQELFDYCLSEAMHERYSGWDWGWDLAQIAADLVKTEDQRERLYDLLDEMVRPIPEVQDSKFSRQLRYNQAEAIKYSIVNRLDDDEARLEFLTAHVESEPFRERLVHYHIEHGNLEEARGLCNEWLEEHGADHKKHRNTFQDLLLRIAQRENHEEEIIRLTEELFLHSGDFQYYDLLKESVPSDTWGEVRDQLIARADQLPRYNLMSAEIYVREEMWASLLDRVKQAHRGTVERYRELLEPRFPHEICDIYERIVWKILEEKVHRRGYQEACWYLRRMYKLGQADHANALIEALRSEYSNRPALLDELSRV